MAEWIAAVSPTLKLGLTLCVIVVLMRCGVVMGAALLAAVLAIAAFFPLAPEAYARAAAEDFFCGETAFLLTIVGGLLVFSSCLNETGQIRRVIEAFRALVGDSRIALVAFPALIGLLPMPGGAIFSAPMVKSAVEGSGLSPARVTIANHWFRHIWEFWFPLYPGVMLMLAFVPFPATTMILLLLPMTPCSIAIGYFLILRGVRLGERKRGGQTARDWWRFFNELTPILLIVGLVFLLDPLVSRLFSPELLRNAFIKRLPLVVALAAAIAWLFRYRGLDWPTLLRLARTRQVGEMLFLVLGLMAFKAVLMQCGAVEEIRLELTAKHVPLALLVCILPFVTALVLGVSVGFVGSSFPLVVALTAPLPEAQKPAYYFLAYVLGYTGMMLSPVHLCLIITTEYFRARLLRVYAYLAPLALILIVVATLLFLLYDRFGPLILRLSGNA